MPKKINKEKFRAVLSRHFAYISGEFYCNGNLKYEDTADIFFYFSFGVLCEAVYETEKQMKVVFINIFSIHLRCNDFCA
jgi:hypothetical protein